jgi:hypothetical protein
MIMKMRSIASGLLIKCIYKKNNCMDVLNFYLKCLIKFILFSVTLNQNIYHLFIKYINGSKKYIILSFLTGIVIPAYVNAQCSTCENNLVVNGGLNTNLTGWIGTNGNFSSANYYPMCNSARHAMIQRTSGIAQVHQDISGIPVGTSLQFSFWAGVHNISLDAKFGVEFHNSNTPSAGSKISESKFQIDKVLEGNPKMQFYSNTVVVPAGTLKVRIIGTATGDWLKFDEVCLKSSTPINQCAAIAPHSTCTPPAGWDKNLVANGNVDWQSLTGVSADNVTNKIRISGTGTVTINNMSLKLTSASAVVFIDGPELIINNGNVEIEASGARYIQNGGALFTQGNFNQKSNTSVCISNALVNIGEEQSGRNFVSGASSTSANFQNDGGYRYLDNSFINVTHDYLLNSSGSGSGTSGVDVIKSCCIEVGDSGSNNAFDSPITSADGSDAGSWVSSNNQYIFDTKISLSNGNFQTNNKPHLFCNVGIKINKSGNFQSNSGSTLGSGLGVAASGQITNSGSWTLTGFTWYSVSSNSTNIPNAGAESSLANITANYFSTACPTYQGQNNESIGGCLEGQAEIFSPGAYIIDMGVSPQTIGNGLKPYGMLYDLIKNYRVEITWVVNPNKVKDGVDFTYNGLQFKGGPFIIPGEFRTAAVNARISYWEGQGVKGFTANSVIYICEDFIASKLNTVPRWTMDKQNGKLAVPYFVNAGIPSSAHGGASESGWKNPAQLDCCDDLFVMPHADPIWSTHQRLYTWNLECRGGIWNACHAGSALENMVNPANRAQQTNFLTVKDAAYTGTSGNYANSNSLLLWGSHKNGTPPYVHRLLGDPVSQYFGTTDAALLNGSEQIFIPRQTSGTTARWNSGAKIIAYDPTQENVPVLQGDLRNAAAVMVYGRGFDDPNRGFVMLTAAHSLDKSTAAANIAAQRTFFNFSWLVAQDKTENLRIESGLGNIVYTSTGRSYIFSLQGGNINNYNIVWESTCGGTFSSNAQTIVFTPPASADLSNCFITVTITDACGRTSTTSLRTVILCDFAASHTVTNPICFGGSGAINITTSGESAIGSHSWNWTKSGTSTTGIGSGNQISGLTAGAYQVTVTSSSNCTATFSATITAPSTVIVTPTVSNYICYGGTGNINIDVSGGTVPYNYAWNGGAAVKNREGLLAGTYTITVTDAQGCTKSSVSTVTGQTTPFTASNTKTDISCFGLSNGSANVTQAGGQSPYSYLWSDGSTTQNRTGLAAGSYVVTVTDAAGCTATSGLTISQPALLSVLLQATPPTCPPGVSPPFNADGSVTLTISGGTPAYTYLWNNGATTQNRTNLAAGTYSVTVTDSKGCQVIKSVTLTPTSTLPNAPTVINR